MNSEAGPLLYPAYAKSNFSPLMRSPSQLRIVSEREGKVYLENGDILESENISMTIAGSGVGLETERSVIGNQGLGPNGEEFRPNGKRYHTTWDHVIPAFQYRKSCGEILNIGKCEHHKNGEKHDTHSLKGSCRMINCPVCYRNAAVKLGHKAVGRLMGGGTLNHSRHLPRHVVVSPPQRWAERYLRRALVNRDSKVFLGRLYQRLYQILKRTCSGPVGGCVVFHPFRITEEGHREYKSYRRRRGNDLKIWNWIQEKRLFEYMEPSPHFHVFMYGFLPPAQYFPMLTGGWIYKVIERSGDRTKYLTSALIYAISHAGYIVDSDGRSITKILRWWGTISYHSVVQSKITVNKSIVHCSCCGGVMYRHKYNDDVDQQYPLVDIIGKPVPMIEVRYDVEYKIRNHQGPCIESFYIDDMTLIDTG